MSEAHKDAEREATRDKKLDRDLQSQLMNCAFRAFDGQFHPRPAKETVRILTKAIADFYEKREARAASPQAPAVDGAEAVAALSDLLYCRDHYSECGGSHAEDMLERSFERARSVVEATPHTAIGSDTKVAVTRDFLGQIVRDAWVKWAKQQPHPKPSWLAPYADLSEADKEADRQIGEMVAKWLLSIKGADWSHVVPAAPLTREAATVPLTDEQIIRAGYMHTVETDEPLFTFDRNELLAMVRELLAASPAAESKTLPRESEGACAHDYVRSDRVCTECGDVQPIGPASGVVKGEAE